MKYMDEYRDRDAILRLADAIRRTVTRPHAIMEICGGQTHAIVRFGLDQLLPDEVTLVHGPGCPVCVTPVEMIDKALALAAMPDVILCSFGDMMRVPGSEHDLLGVKARGGDVRFVYSPLDAVKVAEENPGRQVVFFGIGFETTAPANALAVKTAAARKLRNFSMLVSLVLVPPAMEAILSAERCAVNGFLGPGHVCTIMGSEEYEPIARKYRVPIIISGFEPLDLLQGIHMCVKQLEEGRCDVENQYARSVARAGNATARALLREVFEISPQQWRGLGPIPASGMRLSDAYRDFDAEGRFELAGVVARESEECISGEILQGLKKPCDCPAFGTRCTPDRPLGAPMVSSEGACSAYYRYRPALAPAQTGERV